MIHLSFSFAKLPCVSAPVLRTVCLLVGLVPVVEPLWTTVLVRVVLICTLVLNVVLVVHVFRDLFGMATSLYSVVLIHPLGLGKLVDLAAHEASENFLGELVRDGLACAALGLGRDDRDLEETCLPSVGGPRRVSCPRRRLHLRPAHERTSPGCRNRGRPDRLLDRILADERLELRLQRDRSVRAPYNSKVAVSARCVGHIPQPYMLDDCESEFEMIGSNRLMSDLIS